MILRIDRQARFSPLAQLPGGVLAQVKARLTFPNPAHLEGEKRGFYTGHIPREIRGYRQEGEALVIPRGATRQVVGIIRDAGLAYRVEDRRRTLAPVDFDFRGELRDFQVEAVEAMAERDFGTLAAPTGCGKTVMAPRVVAQRRQPAPGKERARVYDYLDAVGVLRSAARSRARVYGAQEGGG